MKKILIVEDDMAYAQTIAEALRFEGYDLDIAETSLAGIELLSKIHYDLLISDLHLDVLNGNQLVNTAKNINPVIGTIILTAEPSTETELESFASQVDIYLEKNKKLEVILKYVESILNRAERSNRSHSEILYSSKEKISLNRVSHVVTRDDEEIKLTPSEFSILELLLMNKNEALTRERIIDELWDGRLDHAESRVIDIHIKNLRIKTRAFSIVTVRGLGYKWNE